MTIPRVLSAELPAHVGERITIAGWLHRRRDLKSVTFLVIRDRAGLAQVVLPAAAAGAIGAETVLQAEGLVVASEQAPGGAGLPRRAARHRPPPRAVHQPGRGARLHRRPLRRHAVLPRRRRRDGRFGTGTGRPGHADARRGTAAGACPDPARPVRRRDGPDLRRHRRGRYRRARPRPAHERWLGEWAAREHGSDLLFVTGYPLASKPFYTHAEPGRPRYSNGFDLLFRGTEIVTGGQRLPRHEDYLAALAARGLDPAPFEGAANVRQVTLFPRDLHRLSP